MDTLQGLRQKPVRVGKQASQFYSPAPQKLPSLYTVDQFRQDPIWRAKWWASWKGPSFQRYGYLRVSIRQISGHDFTTKDVGNHSDNRPPKKTLQKFPGCWFQTFSYPYMRGNDPIWRAYVSNWVGSTSNQNSLGRWRDGHPQWWCPKSKYGALNALGPHVTCWPFRLVVFFSVGRNWATTKNKQGSFYQRKNFLEVKFCIGFCLLATFFVVGFYFFSGPKGVGTPWGAFSWGAET